MIHRDVVTYELCTAVAYLTKINKKILIAFKIIRKKSYSDQKNIA